jgi:ring-1,2-phenylacetyl-CoA epoxidase subunit PaaE
MAIQFHPLKIVEITEQGDDGVSIGFEIPGSLEKEFAFEPGQYLTLRANVDGEDIRRSYSICSPVSEKLRRVGIRILPDGKFSTFAKSLKAGDTVEVMPPQGRFTAELGGTHEYLLIAAGSGITPILSIAQSVLESEPDSQITMIYGNKRTSSIMFREGLEELKDRYLGRFSLIHILSQESQDVELANGRIDVAKLELMQHRGLIDPKTYDGIYICGPQDMIETCSAKFRADGAEAVNIHFELFTPADGSRLTAAHRAQKQENAAGNVEVTTILDGTSHHFKMDGKVATVLDAAHNAGIELPFSCAGGMCCTCRCQVAEGEAEMDVNYSLEPWEIEAGFILACQARPKTEKLVLDFDAS